MASTEELYRELVAYLLKDIFNYCQWIKATSDECNQIAFESKRNQKRVPKLVIWIAINYSFIYSPTNRIIFQYLFKKSFF